MEENKYEFKGILNKLTETSLEILELTIRNWTQNYKEFLDSQINSSSIPSIRVCIHLIVEL